MNIDYLDRLDWLLCIVSHDWALQVWKQTVDNVGFWRQHTMDTCSSWHKIGAETDVLRQQATSVKRNQICLILSHPSWSRSPISWASPHVDVSSAGRKCAAVLSNLPQSSSFSSTIPTTVLARWQNKTVNCANSPSKVQLVPFSCVVWQIFFCMILAFLLHAILKNDRKWYREEFIWSPTNISEIFGRG